MVDRIVQETLIDGQSWIKYLLDVMIPYGPTEFSGERQISRRARAIVRSSWGEEHLQSSGGGGADDKVRQGLEELRYRSSPRTSGSTPSRGCFWTT